jgi:hypothetical protein
LLTTILIARSKPEFFNPGKFCAHCKSNPGECAFKPSGPVELVQISHFTILPKELVLIISSYFPAVYITIALRDCELSYSNLHICSHKITFSLPNPHSVEII